MDNNLLGKIGRFGALQGQFLSPEQAPGYYNQTFNDPYLYYHNYNRVPFKTKQGDIRLLAPELPPVNVLNNPKKYNVGNNIRDILGGNNRSGFNAKGIQQVQQIAGTQAPLTPSDALIARIIEGLKKQKSQEFIKTPPIGGSQYSRVGLPNVQQGAQ